MNFDDIIKQVEDNPYSAFFYTPSIYKREQSYFLTKPLEIVSVYKREDLDYAFKVIHKLIDKGYFGYSLIRYEAGFLFEQKLSNFISVDSEKLLQFFFFDRREVHQLKSSKIIFNEFSPDKYSVLDFKLNRSDKQFFDDIKKIKHHIKEGNTYQVNYTVKGKFNFTGSHSAFFQKLLFNQSAKYSSFINNDEEFILSLSPELFFHKRGRKIISHPMKGTIRRGHNHSLDRIGETELKSGEKNRAENVMIVDLERNDIGRVCQYGSVKVTELAILETFPTVFHLASTVVGKLRQGVNRIDLLKATFREALLPVPPRYAPWRLLMNWSLPEGASIPEPSGT